MVNLNTEGQIAKLDQATRLANEAAAASGIASRLGALVLYAGIVDFCVIQAARLIEQIMLKGQLAEGKEPRFFPHDDAYFFKRRVSTARILKGIRKLLPFKGSPGDDREEAVRGNELAETMIRCGLIFLNCRDLILHQIGNPPRTFEEVLGMVDPAIASFRSFMKAHKEFFKLAAPYRFGPKELGYFYGEEDRRK